jgi:hypothetical protein
MFLLILLDHVKLHFCCVVIQCRNVDEKRDSLDG